jgi:hypothetical protein
LLNDRLGKTFSEAGTAVGPIEYGIVKSVPGYGPEPFEANIVTGADVFHVESTFKSVHLDFRSVIKPAEGELILFTFTGFIEGNADTAAILKGDPNAKSSSWGSSCTSYCVPQRLNSETNIHKVLSGTFEVSARHSPLLQISITMRSAPDERQTGNQKWLGMNRKIYVGSQRLIKEPGKPLFVEINLSEVCLLKQPRESPRLN